MVLTTTTVTQQDTFRLKAWRWKCNLLHKNLLFFSSVLEEGRWGQLSPMTRIIGFYIGIMDTMMLKQNTFFYNVIFLYKFYM